MCRTLKARTPADLLLKIREAEAWPRVEGDSLRTIHAAKLAYEFKTTRDGFYAAVRRACADPQPQGGA